MGKGREDRWRALGNETNLKILGLLDKRGLPAEELFRDFSGELSYVNLYLHLGLLEKEGLVRVIGYTKGEMGRNRGVYASAVSSIRVEFNFERGTSDAVVALKGEAELRRIADQYLANDPLFSLPEKTEGARARAQVIYGEA